MDELYENSPLRLSKEEYRQQLEVLLQHEILKQEGEYILTPERDQNDILKRVAGNNGAKEIMPVAHTYARKIASFPFVEGVCLSGSISKNYYDINCDIDYFVITKPGRLWICRTLVILRYKLLPARLKRFWCTNYFISSDCLTIPDVNAFTGTELAFLMPVVNYKAYRNILNNNEWYRLRFPNKEVADGKACIEISESRLRSLCEYIFSGRFGSWLDAKLLDFTLNRWKRKFPHMNEADFELQYRSRKGVCKRHTHGFQNKVLLRWQKQIREFEQKYNVVLNTTGR